MIQKLETQREYSENTYYELEEFHPTNQNSGVKEVATVDEILRIINDTVQVHYKQINSERYCQNMISIQICLDISCVII